MTLTIQDPEAQRFAEELAACTGETLTEAVVIALRERLQRERRRVETVGLRDELREIRQRCSGYPVRDDRSSDEILPFDDDGLPV